MRTDTAQQTNTKNPENKEETKDKLRTISGETCFHYKEVTICSQNTSTSLDLPSQYEAKTECWSNL